MISIPNTQEPVVSKPMHQLKAQTQTFKEILVYLLYQRKPFQSVETNYPVTIDLLDHLSYFSPKTVEEDLFMRAIHAIKSLSNQDKYLFNMSFDFRDTTQAGTDEKTSEYTMTMRALFILPTDRKDFILFESHVNKSADQVTPVKDDEPKDKM